MGRFVLLASFLIACAAAHADWKTSFDGSTLTLQNGEVKLEGELSFSQDVEGVWIDSRGKVRELKDGEGWKVVPSRDGVKERLAVLDPRGEVQGYVVFPRDGDSVSILFYHRTAQSFEGRLLFKSKVSFRSDAFACDSFPSKNFLRFKIGYPDSPLDNSIFSPAEDELLRFSSEGVGIERRSEGIFGVSLAGGPNSRIKIELVRDYFKSGYVPYYVPLSKKGLRRTPTGWMSWNTYFDKATAEDNLKEAKIGAKYLKPFGCEFWSIESWQGNSDSLPVSKFHNMNGEVNEGQFPLGMKRLADDIRSLGFKPGIWVAPFGTGNDKFYEEHKEWFLRDSEGKPLSCWNGKYTLDPTVKEAREHLKNLFRKMRCEWGYEFFKIDGMSGRNSSYCAHMYERPEVRARFSDPECKNPFELCVEAFREGIGDAVFLACQGHFTGPEAKYAELARSGADIVSPNKPVGWSNVLNQAKCTENQAFVHNICMVLDPDTLLVRDLGLEQARVSATIVALPGQLTFFGDKLEGLSPEKMWILQRTLPVRSAVPALLYPVFGSPNLWILDVENSKLGNFKVVAFFNWGDEEADIFASSSDIGVDGKYLAFEFWTEKFMGLCDFSKPFGIKVPARGVRVVKFLKGDLGEPKFLGSDRHVSQSGFEMKSLKSGKDFVSGEVELVGKFPMKLFFYNPSALISSSVDGARMSVSEEKDVLEVELVSDSEEGGVAKFELKFR